MKKLIVSALTVLMIISISLSTFAATSSTLGSELYAIGATYGMTSADKVKVDRYLSENPLSDSECDQIISLAYEAKAIMDANGTTDVYSLPSDVKAQLKSLAVSAASIAGVTIEFTNKTINVYKNGTLIDVIGTTTSTSTSTLAYTGNTTGIALVITTILAVALTGIVCRRKFAYNA